MPPRRKPMKNGREAGLKSVSVKVQPAGDSPLVSGVHIEAEATDGELEFSMQLMWCVQEIDALRLHEKTTPKLANQLCKTISTLLNPKIPLIKKRQLMSAYCGDYREKMAKEDKKIRLAIPFVAARSPCPSESFVLRKRNVTAAVVGDDSTCNGADATEVVSRASDLVTSFDHAHISDTGPPCAVHASNLKTMKSNTQVLFTNYTKDSIPFSFNFDVNEDS